MPNETALPAFSEWIAAGGLNWLLTAGIVALVALAAGYLIAALRHGPVSGLRITGRVLREAAIDLARISPRRVWALAGLGVKESIRRMIVVVFAIFLLLLLFAGWFLDTGSSDPARLYLGFVLTATSYLVLLLVLFLSVFSLPTDLKNKTLHTVVTKPVRTSEVVLGRMLGFALVGTGLLALMSVVSYFFVVRGLAHTHELAAENLSAPELATTASGAKVGFTESAHGHRHRVYVEPSGQAHVETEQGHSHSVETVQGPSGAKYALGNQEGMLLARVPVYGKLRFRDVHGVDTDKGINVGDEWTYRSFIQGGSEAAAVWTFNVKQEDFPASLPIEMNIGVFRTYKGDIEKGVLGSLALRNPRTGLRVEVKIFESKEFVPLKLEIPREIKNFSSAQVVQRKAEGPNGMELSPLQVDERLAKKRQFDLFEDLVDNGQVEVWLRCAEPQQYFGTAQPDLYLRADDASFTVNFFKGYLGIWLQMLLVIGFGVMFSTIVSGPVGAIATGGVLTGGLFLGFMTRLAQHQVYGGGPFESIIRLVTQDNVMTDLAPGLQTDVMRIFDSVAEFLLRVVSSILPPFGEFSYADHVAYGFDVSWNPYIVVPVLRAIGYLLPVFVAAYFFLKTREVAR